MDRSPLSRRALALGLFSQFVSRKPALAAERFHTVETVLSTLQTTSMLVLCKGGRVFEYGNPGETSYLASARKSLISMLYGPSVRRGAIRLHWRLSELGFDDLGGLLPVEREATIRDLLTARSGVYHGAANLGDAAALAPARGSVRPGTYFLYNNWDFNALGAIFERTTGRKVYRAFGEDIAGPIGLEDWNEEAQPIRNDTGLSKHPAHHFVLSTRDMARLGLLMQRGGRHGRVQVLPAAWVKLTTGAVTPAAEVARTSPFVPGLGYGYLWWTFAPSAGWDHRLKGAYTASGAYGQFITVIPRLELVVAHKTAVPPARNVTAQDYLSRVVAAVIAACC